MRFPKLFTCLSLSLLLFGCSTIQLNKDNQSELIVKLSARALAVRMVDHEPEMACKAKEYCERFLEMTKDDTELEDTVMVALCFLNEKIDVNDELIRLTFLDLINSLEINLTTMEINNFDFELIRSAITAYLEGVNIKIKDLNINCQF
jgi:hypothetical protein